MKVAPFRLPFILLLACVHGLIYVFAVPPWQHYDEPGHFDYVWHIAHDVTLADPNTPNPELHAAMVRSMLKYGFFKPGIPLPDLANPSASIGFRQSDSSPVYYSWAALPVRLALALGMDNVTQLLYGARLMGLPVFLMTVGVAAAAMHELFAPQHAAVWLVPLLFALLPSMADLMTALNDDVMTIAFGTLLLWISIRIARRGLSLERLLLLGVIAISSVVIKRGLAPMAVTLPVVLLLGITRARIGWRWLGWGVGSAVIAGLAIFLLRTLHHDGVQAWATRSPAGVCAHSSCPAFLGQRAIQTGVGDSADAYPVMQLIGHKAQPELAGRAVTFGAWMWADDAISKSEAHVVIAGPGGYAQSPSIPLTAEPSFHAFTLTLSPNLVSSYVYLFGQTGLPTSTQHIYFDGLTLANDVRAFDPPPQFTDSSLQTGTWAGRPFVNFIRNPSAEVAAWAVDAEVDRWTQSFIRDTLLSHMIYIAQDPEGQYYYRSTAEHWLHTFWARFGWGNLPLANLWVYDGLLAALLAALTGVIVAVLRAPRQVDWLVVLALALPTMSMLFAAFTRGASSVFVGVWLPGWRYAAPANLTVLLLLALGWRSLAQIPAQRFGWSGLRRFGPMGVLILLLCLDAYALYSQYVFYNMAS